MEKDTRKLILDYIFSHTQHIKKVLLSWMLTYDGNVDNLIYALDEQKAMDWRRSVKHYVNLTEVRKNFKGKEYKVKYPFAKFYLDPNDERNISNNGKYYWIIWEKSAKIEEITQDYIKIVQDKVRIWIYDEVIFFLEQELLHNDLFAICLVTINWEEEKQFVTATRIITEKVEEWEETYQASEIAGQKTAATPFVGGVEVDLMKYRREAFNDKEVNKYFNMMLTISEAEDWYVDMRDHSIVQKISYNEYKEVPYRIGQDIRTIVNHETKTVESIELKETECEHYRDNREFYIKKWTKIILASEFKTVERKVLKADENGNPLKEEIKVYGAYTHILRKMLRFTPFTRQLQYLLGESRINFLAGKRRAGKTRLVAYLIIRQLYRQHQHLFQSERPSKTTYVSFKDEALKDVVDYIKTSTKKITLLNVIKHVASDNRLYLSDEKVWTKGEWQTKHYEIVGLCDFITGGGYQPWRGKASDLILIDEAAYVPEAVFKNLMYIVTGEKAKMLCCSTISVDTPANWFWKWLNTTEIEQITDSLMFAMRVTIDDIDDYMMSEEEKEFEKKIAMSDISRYYAELYCIVPNIDDVFDITGIFTPLIRTQEDKVLDVLIWYDPAKRSDYSGIIVWLEMWVNSLKKKKLHIIEEFKIQGEYTTTQKKFMLDLRDRLKNEYRLRKNPSIIFDATQVGDAVSEVFMREGLCDYRVRYTTQARNPEPDDYGVWKTGKGNLVEMAQVLLSQQDAKINNELAQLREEMINFKKKSTNGVYIKYEAQSGNDDLVNAFMLVCFLYWFFKGNIYSPSNRDPQGRDLRYLYEHFDQNTGLLKPTNRIYKGTSAYKEYEEEQKYKNKRRSSYSF
jgi:hypothetical protein